MKINIISHAKLAAIAFFAIICASCRLEVNAIEGSGNVVTEDRKIAEEFTKIDADNGLEVVIEQSDSREVTVSADDNVIKHITTRVENGTLKITSDFSNYRNVKSRKVMVRMPVIDGIEASGGVSMTTANTIRMPEIYVKSGSGSEIKATVESDHVICEASSGSTITVKGKALRVETSSSSGSSIDADQLIANEIHAQAASGSSTDVHPVIKLDAKASSGASVDYHGKPQSVTKEESSGGSVSEN